MNALVEVGDFLWVYGASNALVATPIALLAGFIQTKVGRPDIAHILWLLVLVKLVTPPLIFAPVLPTLSEPSPITGIVTTHASTALPALSWKMAIATTWIVGSILILACSLVRILRFNRLIHLSSYPVDIQLQEISNRIARTFGLNWFPIIEKTTANISPMTWCIGRRPRIYLPAALIAQMDERAIELVIAHELGHIARRDYLTRVLELATSVLQWWNPLAWWARARLRLSEEICCDAFVTHHMRVPHRDYARMLLSTLELLSKSAIRSPILASQIHGGGPTERRIKMMLLHQSMPVASRWLRYVAALAILVLAPLGLSVAQDHGNRGSDQQRLESGTLSTTASDETMLTAETSRLLLTETAEIRRWHAERLTELESLSSRINAGFEVAASDSDRAAALLAELRSFRAEIERQAMRAAAERREKADQLLELLAEEYPSGPTADAATR